MGLVTGPSCSKNTTDHHEKLCFVVGGPRRSIGGDSFGQAVGLWLVVRFAPYRNDLMIRNNRTELTVGNLVTLMIIPGRDVPLTHRIMKVHKSHDGSRVATGLEGRRTLLTIEACMPQNNSGYPGRINWEK